MEINVRLLEKKVDDRGFLFEVLRAEQVNAPFGQIFVSSVMPGKVKGNHFHKRKREWYLAIRGKVKVHFLDTKSGERKEIILDEKKPSIVEIPIGVSHAITNEGKKEAVILSYISESFNKDDPDTFEFKVV